MPNVPRNQKQVITGELKTTRGCSVISPETRNYAREIWKSYISNQHTLALQGLPPDVRNASYLLVQAPQLAKLIPFTYTSNRKRKFTTDKFYKQHKLVLIHVTHLSGPSRCQIELNDSNFLFFRLSNLTVLNFRF